VGAVLILHIAFASISLFACILQLFISSKRKRDLLFLANAVASAIIFVTFSFSIIFASKHIDYPPFFILRFQLIFTIAILSSLLGVIYHIANDDRKLYIFINSSIFWVLILISLIIPDHFLFGEHASIHRHSQTAEDSFLMISKGFTTWRAFIDITIQLFIASSVLIIARKLDSIKLATAVPLYFGLGFLIFGGLYDQLIDLGYFHSGYLLQYSGFALYMILSFFPFYSFVKALSYNEAIAERDKKWQSLVQNTELIVVGLNRMGQVEFLSPYFFEITGFKREEVIGKDWFEFLIPPDEYFNVQGAFVELLAYEFHPHYVNPILTKDKEKRMIRWFNVRTRDQEGIITGSLSIGVDISEDIKEKETIRKRLQEAENFMEILHDKSIDPRH
jgi:PAS domain S-box-containing protein